MPQFSSIDEKGHPLQRNPTLRVLNVGELMETFVAQTKQVARARKRRQYFNVFRQSVKNVQMLSDDRTESDVLSSFEMPHLVH